jgi:hypothetical protein
VWLDRAIEDKGRSNGLSAYTSAFADTSTELRGFHAFFDPATINRMQGLGVSIPADWELTREAQFYSKLVTVIVPLFTDAALTTLNGVRPVKFAVATVSGSASFARFTPVTVSL